jgi:tetratricopeptide (TPR) repeat protein
MLLSAVLAASFLTPAAVSVGETAARGVVAVPFGDARDVAGRAMSDAVEGALPVACQARGLVAVRADKVKPVLEALRACADDACKLSQVKRLGARFALLGRATGGGLALRLVDVEGGEHGSALVDGLPPAALGRIPMVVDGLLEQVAPEAAHRRSLAFDRARAARAQGDVDAADAAYAEAIGAGAFDEEAAELWLARVRMWDQSGDRARAWSTWDAFATAFAARSAGSLDDDTAARMSDALKTHLLARATTEVDIADADHGADHDALVEQAVRTYLLVASLFEDERGRAFFSAAELLREAGRKEEAAHLYEEVANDARAVDELRVRALARAKL